MPRGYDVNGKTLCKVLIMRIEDEYSVMMLSQEIGHEPESQSKCEVRLKKDGIEHHCLLPVVETLRAMDNGTEKRKN